MPRWLKNGEAALGLCVDAIAALLVVLEVAILFWGIVARYVFNTPLIWSDETASILFIWLAMLGAVIAVRRGSHMRMTALVSKLGPAPKALLESVATAAGLLILLLLLKPAYVRAIEDISLNSPMLEISGVWRSASFPVGIGLMLLFSTYRLFASHRLREAVSALLLVGAIAAAFWIAGPLFKGLGNFNLVIFFVGVVVLTVFSGVPIVFSFALATYAYLALSTRTPLMTIVGRMDEGMSHIILIAVPLFVFLGMIMEMSGMARVMVQFLAALLGHVRGGLSYVLIGAMYLVSGISGSKAADMAAVAPALFPEMISRGAKPGDLVALLSATGAQTETVPPSIVLITIGSVVGVSIAALFTGGLLPSLVLAAGLCAVVGYRHRKEDLRGVARAPASAVVRALVVALPALALPFVIRASVVEGIATATEVSTIGIVYSLVVGAVIYRQMDWRRLGPALVETACLSGAILFIIGAASAMAWGLTQSGFSKTLADAMTALPGGRVSFLAVSIAAFIVLGSVLEGIPAVVLFGPLLFPVARTLGIHEVHYAMVVVLAMGLGLFSPPFGVGYYTACAIGRVDPEQGIGSIWAYMVALLIGLALVAAVPWLSIGFL